MNGNTWKWQQTLGSTTPAKRLLLGIGMVAACLAGCTPAAKKKPSTTATNEPSVARQALEGFTGKTTVDAGQRTKKQIQEINKARQEQFEGL